jgi:hypothetical protein
MHLGPYDQNRNGRRLRVVLRRDGVVFFRGIRTTRPPSGSFEIERPPVSRPGTDRIAARAVNLRSGEVCLGAARI